MQARGSESYHFRLYCSNLIAIGLSGLISSLVNDEDDEDLGGYIVSDDEPVKGPKDVTSTQAETNTFNFPALLSVWKGVRTREDITVLPSGVFETQRGISLEIENE